MATWRCPNCRTLQGGTAHCILCGRSATSCGTCANFRGSVVGGLGYCALDKRRAPLSGDERRECWSAAPTVVDHGLFDIAPQPHADNESDVLTPAPVIAARPVSAG